MVYVNKKGAFQLSVSLIVIIVFAVVLLSLSLGWIQGFFDQFGDITHQVNQQAIDKIISDIESSGKTVGLASPGLKTWKKGDSGLYSLVVKNNDDIDSLDVTYNIFLEEIGGEVAQSKTVAQIETSVNSWITYSKNDNIAPTETKELKFTIKPPAGTDSGIYFFKVVVCENTGYDYKTCIVGGSNPVYGTEGFFIEIGN